MAKKPESAAPGTELVKIEYRPLASLLPYDKNPKTHPREQLAKIAASILEFGFVNPILIDKDKGIIAGHGRFMAATELKLEQVPVIELSHLTPMQARALLIADNRLSESAIDESKLAEVLLEIQAMGGATEITGYDDDEVFNIIHKLQEETEEAARAEAAGEAPGQKKSKAPGTPIIQYNIVFETNEQQNLFYAFLSVLKDMYPDAATIGERLARYIQDNHAENITGLLPDETGGPI